MQDRIARVLKGHGAQYVEIRLEQSESTNLRYRGKDPEEIGRNSVIGGNAYRSLASMPSPSHSVLLVDDGDVAYDDMVRDIKEGIIVEQLLGAGQGNLLAADFNANVLLGYRVSYGEVIGRVKGTMITGNVYDVLSNLVGIGDSARWIGGRIKVPALYCRGVSVSAKEQKDRVL